MLVTDNEFSVLATLEKQGGLSTKEITALTQVGLRSVQRILKKLYENSFVELDEGEYGLTDLGKSLVALCSAHKAIVENTNTVYR